MILVPVTVVFLCLCAIALWRRKWMNGLVYSLAAMISLLVYALWAQSHKVDVQQARIDQLNRQLSETKQQVP